MSRYLIGPMSKLLITSKLSRTNRYTPDGWPTSSRWNCYRLELENNTSASYGHLKHPPMVARRVCIRWAMGAFTYYVSPPRGGEGVGLKLTFAYGGGRGGSWPSLRKHVSIADLEITIYEEFPRQFFCVKTSLFRSKIWLQTENLRFLGKSECSEVLVVKI